MSQKLKVGLIKTFYTFVLLLKLFIEFPFHKFKLVEMLLIFTPPLYVYNYTWRKIDILKRTEIWRLLGPWL